MTMDAQTAIDGLLDSDPEVRVRAAAALAEVGDHRAAALLERMALDDEGTYVVERAFFDEPHPIFAVAVRALDAIYACAGARPEDVTRMTGLLYGETEHVNGNHNVLAAGGDAMRPALRQALADPDSRVVIRAIKALGILQDSALATALSHQDPQVRRSAVEVWPPSNVLLSAFIARLGSEPDAELRELMLKRISFRRDVTSVLALLGRRNDPDHGVRKAAAFELRVFESTLTGWDDPDVGREALAWVKAEPDPDIQANVLRYAPALVRARGALAWLRQACKSEHPHLRRLATEHLRRLRPPPRRPVGKWRT